MESEHITIRTYSLVWLWLIALTAIEVFLGYIHVPLAMMLVSVIGLSIIKAVLIMAYFMHLKFERLSLILTIVPAMVVCILLFLAFFPDGFRAFSLKTFR
ncbi:MAG: cytochrome C oxidase subunit IV family protein [Acidobacteria bacterium]|nr:cytochrome C oxidase subunit IV family protein [Acidobacteriota bacterium]